MIIKRLCGLLLIVAAVAGFIFSATGLYEIWQIRPGLTKTVGDNLVLLDQTLKTTQDGLAIVGQVVQTTKGDVNSLQTTTDALAKTIHEMNPIFDSITGLTRKDFPAAITATQDSLNSAQSSALLIDNVLSALTRIPFLSLNSYNPDVPLHTSLARVSSSLDSLPPALESITSFLVDGKTNLGVVEGELSRFTETTNEINTALVNAQDAINQYQKATTQLKAQVENAIDAAPGWIVTVTWILTVFLIWLMIAQIVLLTKGSEMLRGQRG